MSETCKRISVLGLGAAIGVCCGVAMLLLGLMAHFCNWGVMMVDVLSSVYLGYKASVLGSFIGLAYGFIDGFIGGVIIAWVYNRFVRT